MKVQYCLMMASRSTLLITLIARIMEVNPYPRWFQQLPDKHKPTSRPEANPYPRWLTKIGFCFFAFFFVVIVMGLVHHWSFGGPTQNHRLYVWRVYQQHGAPCSRALRPIITQRYFILLPASLTALRFSYQKANPFLSNYCFLSSNYRLYSLLGDKQLTKRYFTRATPSKSHHQRLNVLIREAGNKDGRHLTQERLPNLTR